MKKTFKISSLIAILGFVIFNLTINSSVDKQTVFDLSKILSPLEAMASSGDNDDPNYSYAKELTTTEVYGTVVKLSTGIKVLIECIPAGASVVATYEDHLVAEKKNCNFWLLAKCDQSKVGIFPVSL